MTNNVGCQSYKENHFCYLYILNHFKCATNKYIYIYEVFEVLEALGKHIYIYIRSPGGYNQQSFLLFHCNLFASLKLYFIKHLFLTILNTAVGSS